MSKVRIRQELPTGHSKDGGLPSPIKKLILYFMIHDFFHTKKHQSKIFYELELNDIELMNTLRRSHDTQKPEDPFLIAMSRFDQLAAALGRKKYAPVRGRYNFSAQQRNQCLMDPKQLVLDISKVVNEKNLPQIYRYIYESEELDWLVESRNYGFSSLRNHLLIGINLIVHSYQKGYLNKFLNEVYSNSDEEISPK
jgi:hypothetical protein